MGVAQGNVASPKTLYINPAAWNIVLASKVIVYVDWSISRKYSLKIEHRFQNNEARVHGKIDGKRKPIYLPVLLNENVLVLLAVKHWKTADSVGWKLQ